MKAVSVAQMREIDRRTIDDFGIPSMILMENAGRITAETIIKYFNTLRGNPRLSSFFLLLNDTGYLPGKAVDE
ncbi:MAG: hypothetical protein A2252_04385 [Elusimicrobia bacterium RIFOXYA2_FULL_39_19]|nr:MAG: hypothetical protein A2252_04385 [Elusimicrobia bacterium RIFOXYA2_FULL_39_19]